MKTKKEIIEMQEQMLELAKDKKDWLLQQVLIDKAGVLAWVLKDSSQIKESAE